MTIKQTNHSTLTTTPKGIRLPNGDWEPFEFPTDSTPKAKGVFKWHDGTIVDTRDEDQVPF